MLFRIGVVFLPIVGSSLDARPQLSMLIAAVAQTPISGLECVDAFFSIGAFDLEKTSASAMRRVARALLFVFLIHIERALRFARLPFLSFLACWMKFAIAMVRPEIEAAALTVRSVGSSALCTASIVCRSFFTFDMVLPIAVMRPEIKAAALHLFMTDYIARQLAVQLCGNRFKRETAQIRKR